MPQEAIAYLPPRRLSFVVKTAAAGYI